jgi:peptide/nickel transport system substrate-binding protein
MSSFGRTAHIALAALAIGWTTASFAQSDPKTLRIGLREDPDILDPTLGSSYVGRVIYAAMCDKLFDINAKLNIVPQLATGYEYQDPTHLMLHLRANVVFHDGTKFDADAVKFKIDRDRTAKGSMRAGEVNTIASVDVIDPLTVRIALKSPSSPLLAVLTDRAGIMISPKAVEAEGADFGLHPVCAGPFAFESRVPQDRIVLRRFPGYWNADAIHFDRVIYQPIPNSAVRLANLQAGSLDLVEYVVPTDMAQAQADKRLKLAVGDGLAYTGITFNTDNGSAAHTVAGQSALVRRAFELSIDRQALIETVYNGLYQPVAQANTPSSPFYVPSIAPPPRDVAQAKALLKQAGVALPVPIILTLTNGPDIQQAGEVIQSMAAEAGFAVKLRTLEFASSLQAGYAGDFEAYLIGWSGRADGDANMWPFLHRTGTFNYGHYGNDDVDRWLDEARTISDIPQRRDLYAKVWTQERTDMPLVYLWISKNIVGMRKDLNGFVQAPDGLIRLQGVTIGN